MTSYSVCSFLCFVLLVSLLQFRHFLQYRHFVVFMNSNSSLLLLLYGISSYENTTINVLISSCNIWVVSGLGYYRATIRSLFMSLGNVICILFIFSYQWNYSVIATCPFSFGRYCQRFSQVTLTDYTINTSMCEFCLFLILTTT